MGYYLVTCGNCGGPATFFSIGSTWIDCAKCKERRRLVTTLATQAASPGARLTDSSWRPADAAPPPVRVTCAYCHRSIAIQGGRLRSHVDPGSNGTFVLGRRTRQQCPGTGKPRNPDPPNTEQGSDRG